MAERLFDDTIAAVSTPVGEGGIGIVRLSGPASLPIADTIFRASGGAKCSSFKSHTVHYGHIIEPSPHNPKPTTHNPKPPTSHLQPPTPIDEVLLTVMRAPRTYTKEDVVEINCHGGPQALRRVLELVVRSGARIAEPGEFTKRAFLAGRIDLAQAEAVLDVIRSRTEGALKVAVGQLEGGLSKAVNALCDGVLAIAAQVEASIDFPEEGIAPAERRELLRKTRESARAIEALLSTYGEGAVLREGVLAIICGKPNVGKSSLMNLLLKRDRVIVSPIPGTTRDAVEETINLKGIPVRLVDTAGIAETKDVLEREGVERSRKYLALADIAIVVLDASRKPDAADAAIIKLVSGKRKLVVLNKTDLPKRLDAKKTKALFRGEKAVRVVPLSVEKKRNIDSLENAIADMVWSGGFTQGEGAVVSSLRHKELLDKALERMLSVKKELEQGESPEIIAIELREAMHSLGLIIGRSVSDDILERIFEEFCIGK